MKNGMKTPLGRVRGLGSARSGTEHFWRQRLTGAAMVPLTVVFVFVLLGLARADHAAAIATLRSPLVSILVVLFVLTGVAHMRIGMQVILEDYVHEEKLKILAVMANTFFCVLVGAACIWAVLKLNFGI